ncbi:MAG: hypothetical protein A3F75_00265 [Betaproteobacteria bacterium RIFCSPLOWO2_12_FULL_64_23]|nr:MAG: hypothetical protein A3F75_00265 [Betaproteobacteria bacterium RIFCSPLOWO2_12_FULL_64_23]
MLFIRAKNRVGARSAQWPFGDIGGYLDLLHSSLRGRRPVRADRRLRADEKRIRTQSAILYKTPAP